MANSSRSLDWSEVEARGGDDLLMGEGSEFDESVNSEPSVIDFRLMRGGFGDWASRRRGYGGTTM